MTPFYRSLQCVLVQTSGVYTASWLPCGRTFAFAIPHRQTEYRRVVSECLQSGFSCRCSHANVTVLTIRLSTTFCYARPLYTFRAKHRYIFGIGLLIYFIICYSFFSSKHFFQQLLTDILEASVAYMRSFATPTLVFLVRLLEWNGKQNSKLLARF